MQLYRTPIGILPKIPLYISLILYFGILIGLARTSIAQDCTNEILYFPFTEGTGNQATDQSGNGNDGLIINAPPWVNGISNYALEFDGGNDFISIPATPNQNIQQEITLSAWINPYYFGNYESIITKGTTKTAYALQVMQDGSLRFRANFNNPTGGVGDGAWFSNTKLTSNQWYHIAVTYDGDRIRFYINGQLDGNQPQETILFGIVDEPLVIGADFPGNPEYFEGIIDEVRIFCRPLSDTEIAGLAVPPPNINPTASFTANPPTGAEPLPVDFDASASSDPDGNITSYEWEFGDGNTGTGATISHTYTDDGTYTAKLTVTDNFGGTASATRTITVDQEAKQPQTITFDPIPDKITTDPPFTINATASSGLPVSFEVLSGPASTSNVNTVTLNGNAGTVTIQATQRGNEEYDPAPPVEQVFQVSEPSVSDQTITFEEIQNKLTTDPPFTLSATASSGLPVTFEVVAGPATVAGNTVTLTGTPGAVTIRAIQPGNAEFNPAPTVERRFFVSSATPVCGGLVQEAENATLTGNFAVGADPNASGGYYLTIPTGSGFQGSAPNANQAELCFDVPNAGTYQIKAWVYAESGNSDSFFVTVDDEPNNGYYWILGIHNSYEEVLVGDANGANPVEVFLTAGDHSIIFYQREEGPRIDKVELVLINAGRENQTLTFDPIADKETTDPPFTINATASSGLPVTFEVISGPATTAGNTVTLNGNEGVVTIRATQEGNAQYNPAPPVEQSFTVSAPVLLDQIITFNPIADKLTSDPPFNLNATASSGLPVTFEVVAGPATLAGNTVTLNGTPGPVTIRATQNGNAQYNPAPTVEQTFFVRAATPLCGGLVQEAEHATLAGNFTIGTDPSASGGYYLTIPPGSGFQGSAPNANRAELCFDVPTAGTYQIKAWVYAESGNNDSFFVTVDDEPNNGYYWILGIHNSYEEVLVGDANGANPVEVFLTAGDHSIIFYQREEGPRIDKVELVLINAGRENQTLTFDPIADKETTDPPFTINATASSGLPVSFEVVAGPATTTGNTVTLNGNEGVVTIRATQEGNAQYNPAPPVEQSFQVNAPTPVCGPMIQEAETAVLSGNFTIGADPNASGGSYITIPEGAGFEASAPNSHRAELCFEVPEAGIYQIRAWVYAASGNDDSFFVTVDGQPNGGYFWVTGIQTNYDPVWVSDENGANPVEVDLTQGAHTLSFYQREDGPRIDKVELILASEAKENQTITFDPIADKKTTDPPFTLNATASSGLPVTYEVILGPASTNGNTVTLNGNPGTVLIRARQNGNAQYNPAPPVDQTFEVNVPDLLDQTLTFDPIADKETNDPPFNINATASSGLPVSFEVVAGPATVAGNTVTLTGNEGTVTIRATQAGNAQYNPAPPIERSFNVNAPALLDQTLTFDPIANKETNDPPFNINATASSGLPVSFEVVAGPATVAGNTVTLTGNEGTVTIRATQAGNAQYNPAPPIERSFNVNTPALLDQTLTFDPIDDKETNDPPFNINATASSGLPVSFEVVAGPATVAGNTVTLTGNEGTVTIRATQAGNAQYNPAPPIERSFNVNTPALLDQTLTFDPIDDKETNDPPFNINATASSGLPVSFEVVAGPATVAGNTVTLTGNQGTVTIRATQAGNAQYNPAPPIERSFNVTAPALLDQTLTFDPIADKETNDPPFNINATASSGLPVSFEVVAGPATVAGNTVTLTGNQGTVTIRATQAGNAQYNPAPPIERSFNVPAPALLDQTLTFDPIADKETNDPPFNINATASSGLPVNFEVVAGPATVAGNTVTLTGNQGTVTIRATQAGNAQYNPAPPIERSFNVTAPALLDQTLTFDPIADKETNDPPFNINATASSGLPVSFEVVAGPATVAGNTVTLTGNQGTVTIRATQAGNAQYNPAPPIERSFNVTAPALLDQTLTFDPIADKETNDPPFNINATASSGLPVSFEVVAGPATVAGNTVTLTGNQGTVTIRATQAGNAQYNPAPPIERSFNVNTPALLDQTLTFVPIAEKITIDPPFTLTATASSGLPVSFEIVSGPATVTGNILTLTGEIGLVTVRATQGGNAQYNPAPAVERSFTVSKANQTLTFAPLPGKLTTDPPFPINATASSGLPVALSVVAGPATLNGNTLTLTGVEGTVTVEASQPGNAQYNAATPIQRSFQVGRATQTISFNFIPDKIVTDPPFTLTATSTSGLPVSFEIVAGLATLQGNTLTLLGIEGTITVRAFQEGDATYLPAPEVIRDFYVGKRSQSIQFDALADKLTTDPPFDISASASSGLPVALEIVSGPATLADNTVTLTGQPGTVVIRASQPGDAEFLAADPVEQSFSVTNPDRESQTITFNPIPDKFVDDPPFELAATASSGLAVSFTVVSGPASVAGNTVTLEGVAGEVTIRATQVGNTQYNPAPAIERTFEVKRINQSITFDPIPDKLTNDPPFDVNIAASSGLPVLLEILSGPATLTGTTITLTGEEGEVTVRASQAGDGTYNPIPNVTRRFNVGKASQSISFDEIPDKLTIDPPFSVVASASSQLPVEFTILSGPASISGNIITLSGDPGTVSVEARQPGDATYFAAPPVTRSFQVGKRNQAITFVPIPDKVPGDPAFEVQVSASSGLAVELVLVEGPATLVGTTVTLTGETGVVSIRASQRGNAEYFPAPEVTESFVVALPGLKDQTITFENIEDKLTTDPPFVLRATTNSGLPITFSLASGPATLADSILTLTGELGSVTVRANQAGDAEYNPASVEQTFEVMVPGRLDQEVILDSIPDKLTSDPPFVLTARASSGLPVTFSVVSGPATLSNDTLTLTGQTGSVTVRASQEGDLTFNSASAERTFLVMAPDRLDQVIVFDELPDKFTTDPPFTLQATASSGLPVRFALLSGPATLNGEEITLIGAEGIVVIKAQQEGNDTYNPAPPIERTFEVRRPENPEPDTCANNLFVNGSFEAEFEGWSTFGQVVTTPDSYVGELAAEIRFEQGGLWHRESIPILPGETYAMKFWGKKSGNPIWARVFMDFYDEQQNKLDSAGLFVEVESSNYQLYNLNSVAPEAARFIYISAWKNGVGGSLFLDELCLNGKVDSSLFEEEAIYTVYPNPFDEVLYISVENPETETMNIRIFNFTGAEVYNHKNVPTDRPLRINTPWTRGSFLLEIETTPGKREYVRIMKPK